MKTKALFLFVFITITGYALPADTLHPSKKDYYDRIKLRVGGNYNFEANRAKAEIGIYKNDLPFSLHRRDEWGEIINQNLFLATEINLHNDFFIGPKIGFEFNYVYFEGRLNLIDYFDFKKTNNLVFRPELGFTIFGLASLTYGYNVVMYSSDRLLTQAHTISLTYNFQ